jgi:hypothetical protein
MTITIRKLAAALGCSLPQARRWAKIIIGIDPEAGKADGVARTFDEVEGFAHYLAGHLIQEFDVKIGDAKLHVWAIINFLLKEGFWPEGAKAEAIADFDVLIYPGGPYVLRKYDFRKALTEFDYKKLSQSFIEKYDEQWFPNRPAFKEPEPGPVYIVPVSRYLKEYIQGVLGA